MAIHVHVYKHVAEELTERWHDTDSTLRSQIGRLLMRPQTDLGAGDVRKRGASVVAARDSVLFQVPGTFGSAALSGIDNLKLL